MDRHYVALAKSLKRSQTQWWLRVGSWWLLGLILMTLFKSFPPTSKTIGVLSHLGDFSYFLIGFVPPLIWLLAVGNLERNWRAELGGVPYADQFRSQRYLLGLQQTIPILIAIPILQAVDSVVGFHTFHPQRHFQLMELLYDGGFRTGTTYMLAVGLFAVWAGAMIVTGRFGTRLARLLLLALLAFDILDVITPYSNPWSVLGTANLIDTWNLWWFSGAALIGLTITSLATGRQTLGRALGYTLVALPLLTELFARIAARHDDYNLDLIESACSYLTAALFRAPMLDRLFTDLWDLPYRDIHDANLQGIATVCAQAAVALGIACFIHAGFRRLEGVHREVSLSEAATAAG